jgi:glycosyltransferase involved in cell wall biosynthesis
MPRLIHITTVPASFVFLESQVRALVDKGWDVEMISSPGPAATAFARRFGTPVHAVKMERAITPARDLDALARLTDLLLDRAPDIVHAHTPKGGLLGMMSATAALVPRRVYHMRGLVTLTASGVRKELLTRAEQTSCRLAHRVICQSPSLRKAALEQKLARRDKLEVLHKGSNGVDIDRFDAQRWRPARTELRQRLGIAQDAVVVGFVGRLVGDKGIVELARAWQMLSTSRADLHLLLVGPWEERDAVPFDVRAQLEADPRVHTVGFQVDTAPWYACMDMLTLPSHREGFPNVPLEAASMGLPVVSTFAIGCVDAVENGVTGRLVPVGDARALEHALREYVEHPDLRREHGNAGRQRVVRDFRPEFIQIELEALYRDLLRRQS